MTFSLNASMFDLLVLSVIARSDSYGYQISQTIKQAADTKDSALYPILKRLQENGHLRTYDQQFQGRNRKYYTITDSGLHYLEYLISEWNSHKEQIDNIVNGGLINDEK